MKKDYKKPITIAVIILFILILSFLIYFFFFKDDGGGRSGLEGTPITNPFGEGLPTDNFQQSGDDNDSQFQVEEDSRLKQITNEPVSGYDIFEKEFQNATTTTTEFFINYARRDNGHIYETTYDSPENKRITNTTIPKNYETIFYNEGKNIIYRFLEEETDNIKTYFAEIDTRASTSTDPEEVRGLIGEFFVDNINQIIKSRRDQIFGLMNRKNSSGFNSLGFIVNLEDLGDSEVILNSPISEWTAQWIDEDNIGLTTKASRGVNGYSYNLNITSGNLNRVIGPIEGLTTLYSPDGEFVLVSMSDNIETTSYIYNIERETAERTFLDTLVEKCVWGQNSVKIYCASPIIVPLNSPDDWYKGLTSFDDNLISYNVETGDFEILSTGSRTDQLDMINLKVSDGNNYLLFQNKRDLSLWAFDLE